MRVPDRRRTDRSGSGADADPNEAPEIIVNGTVDNQTKSLLVPGEKRYLQWCHEVNHLVTLFLFRRDTMRRTLTILLAAALLLGLLSGCGSAEKSETAAMPESAPESAAAG